MYLSYVSQRVFQRLKQSLIMYQMHKKMKRDKIKDLIPN